MKKRDLFIAVIVIIFGISYQFFEKGRISFFRGCRISTPDLIDRKFPNLFKLKEGEFEGIKAIEINNPAGNIQLVRKTDDNTSVSISATIYSKKKTRAESILKEINPMVKKNGSTLKIYISKKSEFPINRARMNLTIASPPGIDIKISNKLGDITSDIEAGVFIIKEKYGDIDLKREVAELDLDASHSKIKISKIKKKSKIKARYSYFQISGTGTLNIESGYSEYYIKNFKSTEDIALINWSSEISLENTVGAAVNIKNSNGKIYLEKLKAESIKIVSKNCKIRLDGVKSEDTIIKNSYSDVMVNDLSGDSINLLLKNLNLNFYPGKKLYIINISASYSDLDLFLEKGNTPFFDINAIYGKIVNTTDISFLTSREKQRIRLSGGGKSPRIVISARYSDIKLKNN